MRLLSRQGTDLRFSYFHDDHTTPYAILSHTWGPDLHEVNYEDVCNGKAVDKLSFPKLDFCLEQAKQDGIEHVWIDTCCIDKKDRNELGEAINKMYDWYAEAQVCYVYLADVSQQDWETTFVKSRWHKRGWTLQELVAPRSVKFYGRDRKYLGDKTTLHTRIQQATSIDTAKPLSDFTISERYAWSFTRQTSKAEDLSYCMLGLLEVKLVFNYGENAVAARERLLIEVDSEHGKRVGREIRKMQAEKDAQTLTTGIKEEDASRLLDNLKFNNMNARRETVNTPYPGTCTWLIESDEYKRWLARDTHLLWIKGKPGAGKSTLIKYAQMQATGMQIDFYFNARGDELERSTFGMYRSLLYQLMERLPYLQDTVMAYLKNLRKYTGHPWVMNLNNVMDVLRFVIGKLEQPVLCFIDALDECSMDEVQEMVHCFEDLHQKAIHICFASRYYPAITIRNSTELHVECHEHMLALEKYVDGRLAVDGYPQGAELRSQVLAKAQGIFFWLVLVVRLLNEELENGTIYNVQKKLDELPAGLSELLNDIVNGPGDIVRLRMSLQWVLFSRRPLTREEYYTAVVTSLSEAGMVDADVWMQRTTTTKEIMDKFVTSSSRGLAKVTKGAETVQFIHESVRDFFLKYQGLQKLYPDCEDPESSRHDALKKVCHKYATSTKAGYPLWTYAAHHMFYHAEQAAAHIEQYDFLQSIDFTRWWDIFDFGELSIHRALVQQDKGLCILAAAAAPRLIRKARLRTNSCSPLLISVMRRNVESLQVLLDDCGADIDAADAHGNTALLLSLWNEFYDLQIVRLLLRKSADTEVQDNRGRTPLTLAAQNRLQDAVELLLQHHARTETPSKGKTALVIAIEARLDPIATMLLRYGADPEAKDSSGNTVLLMACKKLDRHIVSKQQNGSLVEMLLRYRPDIEAQDSSGRTALMIASESRCSDVVEMLLRSRANVHARDKFERSSLLLACTPGTTETAEMLLKAGANPNEVLLKVCSWYASEAFVELLLMHGASLEERDEQGRTALMIACWWSRAATVTILLDKGASLQPMDNKQRTALDWSEPDMSANAISYDPAIKQILWKRSGGATTKIDHSSRGIPTMTIDEEDGSVKRIKLDE